MVIMQINIIDFYSELTTIEIVNLIKNKLTKLDNIVNLIKKCNAKNEDEFINYLKENCINYQKLTSNNLFGFNLDSISYIFLEDDNIISFIPKKIDNKYMFEHVRYNAVDINYDKFGKEV
jgi:hypothetical protein